MFATVPDCLEITYKSTKCTLRLFLFVRRRSWRVGVLIGVLCRTVLTLYLQNPRYL